MDILVRNLDIKFVNEIDKRCEELKKKTDSKWSRNDYLKLLIENDFDRPLMEYKQKKIDQFLDKFADTQGHNTKVLEAYTNEVRKLIEILVEQNKGGKK